MRNKDFWKKLLVISLVIMFSVAMTACGSNSDTSADGDYDADIYEEEQPEVGEEDDQGWTRIAPKGDKYEVIFDTNKTDIAAIEAGQILGQYYFDDVEFTVSKPVVSDEMYSTLEEYDYKYVMVTQTGGEVTEESGYTLMIFFPDDLEVRAYDHYENNLSSSNDGSGGSPCNFEYLPNKYRGGDWEKIVYMSGPAETHDSIDMTDHEGEYMDVIEYITNKANYYQ